MPYTRKTYDLFISDDLRQILEQIKSESIVADLLLKTRHNKEDLVEDPVNFISVSSQDNSRISYLTTERMGQIDPDSYWTSSRRFHVKPGGFISKIFKDINPKDVEVFSNLFRAESKKPKFTFSILKGEDIRNYYHYSKHSSDYGSLGASCMRYDSCQKLFDLYVSNPEIISMLAIIDEYDKIMGRALLWNFDGNKIMDRIYTINDEQLSFYFKKWATDNGYFYKTQQNWYNSVQFEKLGGEMKILKLDIKLDKPEQYYYPYMDTFRFFNPNTGILSNYRPEGEDHYTLCASDGGKYEYNYLVYDDIDKFYRHRGETVRLDYLNIETHSSRCNYSEILERYILSDNCEWREDVRDYIFTGEYEHLNNTEAIEKRIKQNEERLAKWKNQKTKINPEIQVTSGEIQNSIHNYSEDTFQNYTIESRNSISEYLDRMSEGFFRRYYRSDTNNFTASEPQNEQSVEID